MASLLDRTNVVAPTDICNALSDLIQVVAANQLSPVETDNLAELIERRAKLAERRDLEKSIRVVEKRLYCLPDLTEMWKC